MPLIVLGLFVITGIVIYALVRYGNSGDEDPRSVRERYPHAFPPRNKSNDIFDIFENNDIGSEESTASNKGQGDKTMQFPDDAELEKRKRNIH